MVVRVASLLTVLVACTPITREIGASPALPDIQTSDRMRATARELGFGFPARLGGEEFEHGASALVYGFTWHGDAVVHERLITFTDEVEGSGMVIASTPDLRLMVIERTALELHCIAPSGRVSDQRLGMIATHVERVIVDVLTLDGSRAASAKSWIYDRPHRLGVHRYAEMRVRAGEGAASRASRPGTIDEDDPLWGEGVFLAAIGSYFANDGLVELLQKVAQHPPWYLLPKLIGARAEFEVSLARATKVAQPIAGLPVDAVAYRVPFRVMVNDIAMLDAEAIVVPPLAPLHLTAGIVQITGQQPDSPENRFSMRLLGITGRKRK